SAGLVQMDQHIPLEQRQQGLQLAEAMARSEGQARVAAMTAAAPATRPTSTRPSPIRPAALPPSAPGDRYTPPPIGADPATSATPANSAPVYTPYPGPAPVTAPPPARPAATPPAPAATSGAWRVQLGAFSARASATALWSRLSARMNGATPSYIAVGNVVRLQAGPYATRAAAERVCASVRPQPCFPVGR
ncbi:MAG: SPOR domain-containing protein, partial [Pseudomonadota bacterium]